MTSYLTAYRLARASYSDEKRAAERVSDLPAYLLYRPLSFLITPVFVMLGLSAHAVTLLGLVVALAMPLTAAVFPAHAAYWVCGLAVTFQVLDCTDGNLARMRQRASTFGQMLDSITSVLFWASFLIAAGITTQDASDHVIARHGTQLGLTLGVLLLAQRQVEDTFDAYCGQRVQWTPPMPPSLSRFDLAGLGRVLEQVGGFGGLVVAHELALPHVYLGVVATWQGVLFVSWATRLALRLRETMRAEPKR